MLERRIKWCILLVLVVMVILHLHLGYFCVEKGCALTKHHSNQDSYHGNGPIVYPRHKNDIIEEDYYHVHKDNDFSFICDQTPQTSLESHTHGQILHQNWTSVNLDKSYNFDLEGDKDVLVFLHIQKTGGTTFGRHLINNLEMQKPCVCHQGKKKCDCKNSRELVWLVSRYSTGWRCGLHADWTELSSCVDNMLDKIETGHRDRRYLYMTILREPNTRYLSEYKHVQRGATWKAVRLQCNGRQASLQEVPFCFEGDSWVGVSVDDFMECPYNLANNRQTRMLANLSHVGCYKYLSFADNKHNCALLQSAKDNLDKLAFFGLTEYQLETQYLFERTFGLKFKSDFFQYNHTHSSEVTLSSQQNRKLQYLNRLDIKLYEYAKELFFHRLNYVQSIDPNFPKHHLPWRKFDSNQDNIEHSPVPFHNEEYDEEDENDSDDDDDQYNNRIAQRQPRMKFDMPTDKKKHVGDRFYKMRNRYRGSSRGIS